MGIIPCLLNLRHIVLRTRLRARTTEPGDSDRLEHRPELINMSNTTVINISAAVNVVRVFAKLANSVSGARNGTQRRESHP